MLKYRSIRTGKVVEMLEPHEIERDADLRAEELARSDSKPERAQAESVRIKGAQMAGHARRTLDSMNESAVWERVTEQDPKPEPKKQPARRTKVKADEAGDTDTTDTEN